jgi:hypothetical protein
VASSFNGIVGSRASPCASLLLDRRPVVPKAPGAAESPNQRIP